MRTTIHGSRHLHLRITPRTRRPTLTVETGVAVGPKSDDRERTQKGSPYTIHRIAREVILKITHQHDKTYELGIPS